MNRTISDEILFIPFEEETNSFLGRRGHDVDHNMRYDHILPPRTTTTSLLSPKMAEAVAAGRAEPPPPTTTSFLETDSSQPSPETDRLASTEQSFLDTAPEGSGDEELPNVPTEAYDEYGPAIRDVSAARARQSGLGRSRRSAEIGADGDLDGEESPGWRGEGS